MVAVLVLGGCGFQPLYGNAQGEGSVVQALQQVRIERIPERLGQKLRNFLLDRINPTGAPARPSHSLRLTTSVVRTDLGIERDETATRALLVLSVSYSLYSIVEERVVFNGSERSSSSFNIVASDFATASAEIDALDRSAREISNDIKNRLALYFLRR
jgi:LPS-assembly lipoprotein